MPNIIKLFLRWKEIILITASVRIGLFTLSLFVKKDIINVFYPWVQWDGPHYINIAKNWYQTSGEQALWIVFYPFYPLLIKVSNFLINDFSVSAVLVSIFFSFSASILLYELTLLDFKRKVALSAVWFLNIFPTSYFLQASYTESVYLTTSIACIYFFRKNFTFKSAAAGILTTMTRINGIFLLPLLLLELRKTKQIIALLFIPLGLLFYLLINYFTFGDIFYFTKPLLFNWYKKIDFPWNGVANLIHSTPSFHGLLAYAYYSELATLALILLVGIYTLIKVRVSYGVYVLFNLLLFTSTNFIMSTPRYALVLFPIFISLALINNKLIFGIISIVFLALLIYFTNLYIQGQWAF